VASVTGQDVGVMALANQALVLWHLGDGAGAVRSSDAAVALATRIAHSYSLAFAHAFAARLHQSRRDLAAVEEHAQAVVALSEEKGYFWVAQGNFFLGCRATCSAPEKRSAASLADAIQRMTGSLDAYRAAGARLSMTYMLAQLAETHLCAGELEQARDRLDQAVRAMERGEERYWEVELLRLDGELQVAEDRAEDSEKTLRRGLTLARKRGDRAFELRAAVALGRRLAVRGRVREARKLVSKALGAFADGAVGPDLESARAFLQT
jgi:tetratricopeptide (TPR) repeat protein